MEPLRLREHEPRSGVALSIGQRDELAKVVAVRPSAGEEGVYELTPGSTIGALRLDGLDVVIEPKVPIDRVFFMLSYALGLISDLGMGIILESADDLVEAIVQGY